MFADWIRPISFPQFERAILQKEAWARPRAAERDMARLDWETLGRVLASNPAPDVLVVARGKLLSERAPRTLQQLRVLLQRGIGLCVRHSERHDPGLAEVTQSVVSCFGRSVQLQLFVTPGKTHGFSWHYDAEDVFIVQTAGIKDYYFRKNTVDPRPPHGTRPDFTGFQREVSPLQTARLIAGDCLYIPSRWWHMAKCIEDSLSMSFGVTEPPPAAVLQWQGAGADR